MNILLIKQAWRLMRENTLVSVVSVIGTALSIAMALVVVISFQVDLLGFRPESNRGRMLYITTVQAEVRGMNRSNRSGMSAEVVRECVYSLKSAEKSTAYAVVQYPVSLPEKRMYREYAIKYTDGGFWQVFDFRFLRGKSFTDTDFSSGLPRAVISSTVAGNIFGGEEAVGREIVIADIAYTVTGIVEDVSDKAADAFGDIWVPYSTSKSLMDTQYNEGMTGNLQAAILAHSSGDFPVIREELDVLCRKYNEGKSETELSFLNCPITQLERAMGGNAFNRADMLKTVMRNCLILLLLLLIPALNLIGFVMSSVRKRREEVGIRKAFGATKGNIIRQLLYENFLTTGIGAVIGIILSFVIFGIRVDYMLTAGMLIKPGVFVAAIVFAVLLNLFSAGIPAAHIARQEIINAIKDEE